MAFYRRPEMDDLVFTKSLIEEMNQVDMRAECFPLCHRRELYVEVINTAPKDVCNSNIIASDDNTSSCYVGASWEVVPVKCVSCYTGLPQQYAYPYAAHTQELTFNLAAGMKLKMEVAGDTTPPNGVWMVTLTEDIVYVFSLRWGTTPTVAIFNTWHGGVYGAEERLYGLSVNNISSYSIEIHISQSTFETYVDGTLWMTNQMRLPFIDVRRVNVEGTAEFPHWL
ncbi:uncharacterized protein LOC124267656 [Haliotis rubra]|uniref:uncharacterized protein LOC124267656 n=1 Tax=Haliotis rubra TaxID=36100 RepID=UPI001EE580A2|nr:uncharacterized protein LOC124267656 [Haliotis rubra]